MLAYRIATPPFNPTAFRRPRAHSATKAILGRHAGHFRVLPTVIPGSSATVSVTPPAQHAMLDISDPLAHLMNALLTATDPPKQIASHPAHAVSATLDTRGRRVIRV